MVSGTDAPMSVINEIVARWAMASGPTVALILLY